ncbi:MAG: hypothetical protein AAFW73_11085 [Bacteroidota bacterium]
MNSTLIAQALRFVFLVLLQVLVFKRLTLGGGNFNYVSVMVYPIFILLLPLRTPSALLIALSFLMGITVDLFYDSPGVHASAGVFMAWIRPGVLAILEPRGGYNLNQIPAKRYLGINWFARYAALLLFGHLFFYFSVEAFTFVYIVDIFLRTLSSFVVSMVFVLIYQFLFDPGE